MVGVQCKCCGHRALATPEPPKLGAEILTLLSQSSVKYSECGGSKFAIVMLPPDAAEIWLNDGSLPGASQ